MQGRGTERKGKVKQEGLLCAARRLKTVRAGKAMQGVEWSGRPDLGGSPMQIPSQLITTDVIVRTAFFQQNSPQFRK